MRRKRRNAFTLLELMVVVVIMMTLAGMVIGVYALAQKRARTERSKAALQTLATACEAYYTDFRDWPYPNPDKVGIGQTTVGMLLKLQQNTQNRYWTGNEWDNIAYNITLVWLLSQPRSPEPYLDVNGPFFVKIEGKVMIPGATTIVGPDHRTLYKMIDGFKMPIRVTRPEQKYYSRTWIQLTSAGPDKKFGDNDDPDAREDNIEILQRR